MSGPPQPPDPTGVIGALVVLAVGVGVVAVLDFALIAGQGVIVGRYVLALAPWILALRAKPSGHGGRALQGGVAIGWVLLLVGAVATLAPPRFEGFALFGANVVQAGGAAAVLVALHRAGAFGLLPLFVYLTVGAVVGAALAAVSAQPWGLTLAIAVSNVLIAGHLLPQLVHDLLVVQWARNGRNWDRARASLQGVDLPFILWSIAGHLILAPAILYWSRKPDVVLGAVNAACALGLLGVRGVAGLFSRRGVVALIIIAAVYGIGLAAVVVGDRPY